MDPANSPLLFIAVDASTTSVKSIIFDTAGRPLTTGRGKLTFERIDHEGYEQDANSWWRALCESINSAVAQLPRERHADLTGLAIAHQRETVVLTDAGGEPLAPALLWMDSRCHEDVTHAQRTIGSVRLHAVSGKPACTTPSMYKLMYLLRVRPELRDVSFVHDVHSFLSLRLTGRAVSSFASADPTGLVDMRKKSWSRSLCQLVGVDSHQLPELVEPGYVVGGLTPAAAKETGLPEHVLVYAGAGDGQLAGLGAGVTEPGRAFIDMGTAISCGTLTHRYEIDSAFRTLHAAIPGRYCLETTLHAGMLGLWWLADNVLGSTDRMATLATLEKAAALVQPGATGLMTLPYFTGAMNPYWDETARGALIGLHPSHQPPQIYRSLLEGVAMEQRLHLDGVRHAVGTMSEEIVVLGGGARSDLWCQIFADVLGRPVARCRTAETPALGAAVLAAVSHGVFPSFRRAAEDMTGPGTIFQPGPSREIYDQLYREVYRGLYVDLQERMRVLTRIRQQAAQHVGVSIPPVSADLEPYFK